MARFEVDAIPLSSIPEEFLTPAGDDGQSRQLVWDAPSLWIERLPVLLANELRLWRAHGLPFDEVKLRVAGGGPELLRKVETGEAHIGEIGIFPFIQWRSEMISKSTGDNGSGSVHGARITGTSFLQQLEHYLATSTRRARPTASIKDLPGRAVGVLSRGSCDSYLLEHALKAEGAGEAGEVIELGKLGLYGRVEALERVDACFLVEPALSVAVCDGKARVLKRLGDYFQKSFQWNALFASDTMLASANRKLLLRLMGVYEAAVGRMAEWRDAATAAEKRATDAKSVAETQHAFDAIAKAHFSIEKPDVFRSAVLRGADKWVVDWRKLDLDGVVTCLEAFYFGRAVSIDEFSRDMAVDL